MGEGWDEGINYLKNYYSILQISSNATTDEIKKAFRMLAKKYHPDVNSNNENDTLFKEIQEAYAVLSNDQKRNTYDQKLQFFKNKSEHTLRTKPVYKTSNANFHYPFNDIKKYSKKTENNNPVINMLFKHWKKIPWKYIFITSFIVGWLFCFISFYIQDPYLRKSFIMGDDTGAIQNASLLTSAIYGFYYGLGVMLVTVFILSPIFFISLYVYSFLSLNKRS